MENFEKILENLKSLTTQIDQLEIEFNRLDLLIKQNESLRQNTPEEFYSILQEKLSFLLDNQIFEWSFLRLLLKCLKNSAAAFKQSFSNSENNLCLYLTQFLALNLKPTLDQDEIHFFLNIFQYFFNLIQGKWFL